MHNTKYALTNLQAYVRDKKAVLLFNPHLTPSVCLCVCSEGTCPIYVSVFFSIFFFLNETLIGSQVIAVCLGDTVAAITPTI